MAMKNDFQENLIKLRDNIISRKFNECVDFNLEMPGKFNWIRDVFEPLVVGANPGINMLELVTSNTSRPTILTYKKAIEKCNQLVIYFFKILFDIYRDEFCFADIPLV